MKDYVEYVEVLQSQWFYRACPCCGGILFRTARIHLTNPTHVAKYVVYCDECGLRSPQCAEESKALESMRKLLVSQEPSNPKD